MLNFAHNNQRAAGKWKSSSIRPLTSRSWPASLTWTLSKKERIAYDENIRIYRDTIAVMEGQYQEGVEKGMVRGRAEGREEGRAEECLANARSLKENGVPLDVIVKSLCLTPDEIEQI